MHVVKSKIGTKIAYGENPPVVFAAYETKTLTDADWDRLAADAAFNRHLKNGGLEDVPQVEVKPTPVAAEDPRKQRQGEKKADYLARMAVLDKAEADAKWLADFNALTPEEREAMTGTLTDEQKVLIGGAQ